MKCASNNCVHTARYIAIWHNVLTLLCIYCAADAEFAGHKTRKITR